MQILPDLLVHASIDFKLSFLRHCIVEIDRVNNC